MRPILVPLILLTAGACAAAGPLDRDMAMTCYIPIDSFVGQPATQELGARMLASSHAKRLRWVPKGGVVTMDYQADRLTVGLDEANRVESARCG